MIATSYNNLAGIYQGLGDFEKALQAQQKALAIRKQVYESNHPNIATSYNNLSSCLLYTSPSPRDATLSRMPSSA